MAASAWFRGFMAAVLLLALLALLAMDDRELALSYFGALDPDPASSDLQRNARKDCDWADEVVKTFSGLSSQVRSTRAPLWAIEFEEIRSVRVYEAIPSPGLEDAKPHFFVQLELNPEAQRRVDSAREAPCGSFLVVRSGDRVLDLAPMGGAGSPSISGGAFGSREDAEIFYRSIKERVSHAEISAQEREYWASRNQELVGIAIWYARCDPEHLKGLGDGLYEQILAREDLRARLKRVQCDTGPPQVQNPAPHQQWTLP